MYTRAQRRKNTYKKLKKREKMLETFGKRDGTLYEKHREKIDESLGYMRDGNVSHYANVGWKKTRTKNSSRRGTPASLRYGSRHAYKASDLRKILKEEDDDWKSSLYLV